MTGAIISASAAFASNLGAPSAAAAAPDAAAVAQFHSALSGGAAKTAAASTTEVTAVMPGPASGFGRLLRGASNALESAQAQYHGALAQIPVTRGSHVDTMDLLRIQERIGDASNAVKLAGSCAVKVAQDFADIARGGGS